MTATIHILCPSCHVPFSIQTDMTEREWRTKYAPETPVSDAPKRNCFDCWQNAAEVEKKRAAAASAARRAKTDAEKAHVKEAKAAEKAALKAAKLAAKAKK